MRDFHAHVTQAAKAGNANLLALGDAPTAQGRIGRDARAQERCDAGKIEIGRGSQDEVFVHHDAVGVAAVGDRGGLVLVRRIEGEHLVRAQVFAVGLAVRAGVVGINQTAHPDEIAGLIFCDGRADFGDAADNLVARHDRVNRGHDGAPLVAHLVQVGVADAAEDDFDLNVAFGRLAARDDGGSQQRGGTGGGICFGFVHVMMLLLVLL